MDSMLSPRKKRRTVELEDNDTFNTPKKRRADFLLSTLSASRSPKFGSAPPPASTLTSTLPPHLARLLSIQSSLQHALSIAMATSAVSPCTDTGRVPNVLTHLSLTTAMGFKVTCGVDDIKQLCWLWEWDGTTLDKEGAREGDGNVEARRVRAVTTNEDEDDNPFIDKPSASETTSSGGNITSNADWTRGAMGFIITPTTHFLKAENRRVPAYGLGIEVEIDLADGKGGGMASVARWTAEGEGRKRALGRKLRSWIEIQKKTHGEDVNVPPIPLAPIPSLANSSPTKLSSLTSLLKNKSRSKIITPSSTPSQKSLKNTTPIPKLIFPTPAPINKNSVPFPSTPRTPIESPTKFVSSLDKPPATSQTRSRVRSSSPSKSAGLSLLSRSIAVRQNAISPSPAGEDESAPAPLSTSFSNESSESLLLNSSDLSFKPVFPPQTPSSLRRIGIETRFGNRIETPRPGVDLVPCTPRSTRRGTGMGSGTAQTPRRAALLERIRLKSFSEESPSKSGLEAGSGSVTKEQLRLLGQEEMRRRVLLGRLDEVAATVWAAFSSPTQTSSTPLSVARKRRTMRFDEVVRAVVSSARVPISSADAQDSVMLLMNLCPFFLKPLVIEGEEWVEMPASNPNHPTTPPSPHGKSVSEEEVRNRSPKSVRMEKGGLRDVRERIRREMEDCSI